MDFLISENMEGLWHEYCNRSEGVFQAHRSGLPRDILWNMIPRTDSMREQRLTVLKTAAQLKVKAGPTAGFLYSNLGYVIAVTMAEKAADAVWEDLMKKLIFMNLAWVFMAPARNFAILVVSNQGGKEAAKACDKAARRNDYR